MYSTDPSCSTPNIMYQKSQPLVVWEDVNIGSKHINFGTERICATFMEVCMTHEAIHDFRHCKRGQHNAVYALFVIVFVH